MCIQHIQAKTANIFLIFILLINRESKVKQLVCERRLQKLWKKFTDSTVDSDDDHDSRVSGNSSKNYAICSLKWTNFNISFHNSFDCITLKCLASTSNFISLLFDLVKALFLNLKIIWSKSFEIDFCMFAKRSILRNFSIIDRSLNTYDWSITMFKCIFPFF